MRPWCPRPVGPLMSTVSLILVFDDRVRVNVFLVPTMPTLVTLQPGVVVLKSPKLEGDKLTFDVDVLEGDLAGGDGAASVFMDIINLPQSARRTSHRGAWYHGAN